jgi:hypothetical protein
MGPTQSYQRVPGLPGYPEGQNSPNRGPHSVPGASWIAAELASTMFLGLAADIVKISGKMRATDLADSRNAIAKKLSSLPRGEWLFDLLVEVKGPIEYLVTGVGR